MASQNNGVERQPQMMAATQNGIRSLIFCAYNVVDCVAHCDLLRDGVLAICSVLELLRCGNVVLHQRRSFPASDGTFQHSSRQPVSFARNVVCQHALSTPNDTWRELHVPTTTTTTTATVVGGVGSSPSPSPAPACRACDHGVVFHCIASSQTKFAAFSEATQRLLIWDIASGASHDLLLINSQMTNKIAKGKSSMKMHDVMLPDDDGRIVTHIVLSCSDCVEVWTFGNNRISSVTGGSAWWWVSTPASDSPLCLLPALSTTSTTTADQQQQQQHFKGLRQQFSCLTTASSTSPTSAITCTAFVRVIMQVSPRDRRAFHVLLVARLDGSLVAHFPSQDSSPQPGSFTMRPAGGAAAAEGTTSSVSPIWCIGEDDARGFYTGHQNGDVELWTAVFETNFSPIEVSSEQPSRVSDGPIVSIVCSKEDVYVQDASAVWCFPGGDFSVEGSQAIRHPVCCAPILDGGLLLCERVHAEPPAAASAPHHQQQHSLLHVYLPP